MSKSSRRRGTSDTANRRLPPALHNTVTRKKIGRFAPLGEVEDRRRWHPEGKRYVTPRRTDGRRTRIIAQPVENVNKRKSNRSYQPPTYVPPLIQAFEQPQKISTCVRRKQREEVLHAKKKTGKVGQKRPKWNWFSKIRCK